MQKHITHTLRRRSEALLCVLLTAFALLLAPFSASAQDDGQKVDTLYWGYSSEKIADKIPGGSNNPVAIYVPADVAQRYKGKKISGVRYGLDNMVSSVRVFITEDLNSGSYFTQQSTSDPTRCAMGWNYLPLDQPYEITGQPFYVGYDYQGGYQCAGVSDTYNENGCWANVGYGWQNFATNDWHKNALALSLCITGTDFPVDLALTNLSRGLAGGGRAADISGTVTNLSATAVKGYKLSYRIGNDGAAQTLQRDVTLAAGASDNFRISVGSQLPVGAYKVFCRITGADGKPDASAANDTLSTPLEVYAAYPLKRMVVEEGTGIACGWCPRGIVALKEMYEKYPDRFIGIAVQNYPKNGPLGASLYTKSYEPLTFPDWPNCYIDRNYDDMVSPTTAILENRMKQHDGVVPAGVIEVEGAISQDDSKRLRVKARTTFIKEVTDGQPYRIAFVVTESGVTGYRQMNYYNGGANGAMGGFESMGSRPKITLDHQAREIYGYYGLDGSLPTEGVTAGETYTYETTLDMPQLVQNPANLHIIALLLNTKTGRIENGAESAISLVATGLTDATTATAPAPALRIVGGKVIATGSGVTALEVYTAGGARVPNAGLQPGVYVIKGLSSGKPFTQRVAL